MYISYEQGYILIEDLTEIISVHRTNYKPSFIKIQVKHSDLGKNNL